MPYNLPTEKKVAIVSALAEGSGIRQIERMTGVHRDTIMRLGVKVGKGCAGLVDAKMRDIPCGDLGSPLLAVGVGLIQEAKDARAQG
jgi:hypothetical protein